MSRQDAHATLVSNLDTMLAAARPRLLRFARQRGIDPDAADDVVQDTLIEAWRHFERLRDPDRFNAWLIGICRNVCLRWQQAQHKTRNELTSLSILHGEGNESYTEDPRAYPGEAAIDHAGLLTLDPIEELNRQDLAILLDRALSYLPDSAREALELYYLAELPQREVALRLGLNTNALEVRLHRARRQLRQVLSRELYTAAQEFGLAVDEEAITGWGETRLWCMFCGRRHLQGRFDTLPDGRVNLSLRCPDCTSHGCREWIRSGGMSELKGLKSFRPAFNRLLQVGVPYWTTLLSKQACLWCGARVQPRLVNHNEPFSSLPPWNGLRWAIYCSACGSDSSTYIAAVIWQHPAMQHFMAQHPRWINEPEQLIEYAGQPAFRVHLADITSASRLTLLVHPATFQVLATFQE